MKKLIILSLVLITVLSLGSIGFASGLNGNKASDQARLNATINVKATVGPYAAFLVTENPPANHPVINEERKGELNLNFIGRENERQHPNIRFDIASNTDIGLMAEFAPLTSADGEYQIATKMHISPQDYTTHLKKWSNYYIETTEQIDKIQAVERATYSLTVTGALGEIEDQAAGDYQTEILLTIVAADL